MRNYSWFRVFLFALAFGLACVWMTRGFFVAWNDDIKVNLPNVESENVMPVFISEGRFSLGGGSGPDAPNISFYLESEHKQKVVFRFSNNLGKAVYLPMTKDAGIPYYLECQPAGERIVPIRKVFQLESRAKMLKSGSDLLVTIHRPQLRGKCIVGIPFEDTEVEARSLAENNPFVAETGNEFYGHITSWVSGGFLNQ